MSTLKSLPYQCEVQGPRVVVTLLPGLNDIAWSDIERVGGEILDRIRGVGSPQVLVDAGPLSYMGSAQVALIVRIFKTVEERNGRMVVSYEQPMVREILVLAGLDKIFPLALGREAGWGAIGGSAFTASTPASSESSATIPLAIAWTATLTGVLLAALFFANLPMLPGPTMALGTVVASVVGLGAGLWALSVANGGKLLAIAPVLISVLLLLFGAFQVASPVAAGPAKIEAKEDGKQEAGQGKEGKKAEAADADAAAPSSTKTKA